MDADHSFTGNRPTELVGAVLASRPYALLPIRADLVTRNATVTTADRGLGQASRMQDHPSQ
eukprot:962735-Rhodomonas_salina.2